jgi:pilus assembly protein CpaE
MRAVEVADVTLMVTSLTVPGIHQGRRQSEIIAANGFGDRLRVVINRVVHPMFGSVDLSETQTLLGRKIDFSIANDYPTVSGAIDRGKPLAAIKSKSRVEKDLRAMVTTLAAALRAEVAA